MKVSYFSVVKIELPIGQKLLEELGQWVLYRERIAIERIPIGIPFPRASQNFNIPNVTPF